jgi:hypothetical protein
MEHQSRGQSDDQREAFSTESENPPQDKDVRTEIMSRDKRREALAWAQAYRLIRGGVDEVVEIVEGSQYTIELLVQALQEAACRACEVERHAQPEACGFCRRRRELLAQLA